MASFPGSLDGGTGAMGGPFGDGLAMPSSSSQTLQYTNLQTPNLLVTINGVPLTATVLGASITYGFDVGISTATVDFAYGPNVGGQPPIDPLHQLDNLNYFDVVQIFCGATPGGPNMAALRFTGLYLRTEADLWPHVFHIVCKGNLYRATQYFQGNIFIGQPGFILNGLAIAATPLFNVTDEVTGNSVNGYYSGDTTNSTDSRIVYAILNAVPGLSVDPANIRGTIYLPAYSGTGALIVTSQFSAFWPPYRSAWDQIQLFDQAFIGYRTYEGCGGTIYRRQILGYPTGDAVTTFTEGIDIWDAHGMRTVEELCNAAYVEGGGDQFNAGGQFAYAYVTSNNPFQGDGQTSPVVDQTRSPFIETSDLINSTATGPNPVANGLNADDVANWRLSERNRELVNVQLTTFRDDVLNIGTSIAVNIPHAAVTEPVWIQRVEIRISNQPVLFQQTIYGLGGGLPGYAGNISDNLDGGDSNPPGD